MLNFIEILRAVAVMLITNSHFKGVYPNDICSFGGGVGLALFFMISGYLLANINRETKFFKWYFYKIIRMYIPVWLFCIVELCLGTKSITSIGDALQMFLLTPYWFVTAMAILYVIYFLFAKYVYARFGNSAILAFSAVLAGLFTVLFVTQAPIGACSLEDWKIHPFSVETPYFITQTVWLLCMLIGMWMKHNAKPVEKRSVKILYLAGALGMLMVFMVVKLLLGRNMLLRSRFFLPVSYIGFAYCLFRCCMSCEHQCGKLLSTWVGKLVKLVSVCSLEIYYVQFIWIAALKHIVFPLNFALLCLSILASAYVLHICADWINTKIRRLMR